MACNCLEKSLETIKTEMQNLHPEWTITDLDWENKGWNFSGKGNPINLYNEVKIEYTVVKVNGTTSAPKSQKVSMYGEYCTFCGKKFIEDGTPENDN
jgi:hypothetical protein